VDVEVVFGHSLEADAIDLAGRVEWHVVEEDDFLGGLVTDPLAAEADQVGGRRPRDRAEGRRPADQRRSPRAADVLDLATPSPPSAR